MSNELILLDRVGKKFHRAWPQALLHGAEDLSRKLLRLPPAGRLRKAEFWALQDLSLIVRRGECLGVIGPNGAGKTTLLKLIYREYLPDAGRVHTRGSMQSLLRIGVGLQGLLSGRENIYMQCQQRGLGQGEAEAKLEAIAAFAGLEEAIDAQVKTYSDGMYARLNFAIATSVPCDILLVDEVLAVGDIAFQIRALERLNQLKRAGAAIVFVSHSEMNVRHVADRCLLLFNGQPVAQGEPDALFYKYYESLGYLNRRLAPLGLAPPRPADCALGLRIDRLCLAEGEAGRCGKPLKLALEYTAEACHPPLPLIVQFWSSTGLLLASIDSSLAGRQFSLAPGAGRIRIEIPFLSLAPGVYALAAGFGQAGAFQAFRGQLLELRIIQHELRAYLGLAALEAVFAQEQD
jgi:ABC-type polysaccharide/polyol phosphate transport system ATPase subunit